MAYKKSNANGQGTMANSEPVVIASDQSTVPVSLASVPSHAVTNAGTFATQAAQSGTWNITNVSGTVSLPTGASTAAKQPALGTAGTASSDVITVQGIASMTALKTDGSGVTQPVSGTVTANAGTNLNTSALALETTQTAMSAKLPATLGQKAMAASMAVALASDQASIPVAATLTAETTKVIGVTRTAAGDGTLVATGSGTSTGALRVELPTNGTGIVGLATGSNTIGALTANQSVNVAQMNGVATTMGNGVSGTGVQRVSIASDSTGNIATIGTSVTPGTAATSLGKAEDAVHASGDTLVGVATRRIDTPASSAGTSGDYATLDTDANGAVYTNMAYKIDSVNDSIMPYALSSSFVSGAITTAMTGTTSTSLVAAPGASLRNYITTIIVSNAHATVGTDVVIQDGSGGTTLLTIPAAAAYGGATITLPVPLRQPTANTALFCANVTTGASTKVSAVGFKAA